LSKKAHGQIRQSQAITTWGPGALLDLPKHSVIVGGLESWPKPNDLDEVVEPRLSRRLERMTGVRTPRLFAPPPDTTAPGEPERGIGVYLFPQWFIVQEDVRGEGAERSRRLVNRKHLDENGRLRDTDARGRPRTLTVIPIRFVRACRHGHVDDIDWYGFVHGEESTCRGQLWLDELGASGDLSDLIVRCECGRKRPMHEATIIEENPLGPCTGARPWLGPHAKERCRERSRLLTRTATNAYFPKIVNVLSLPDRGTKAQSVVDELWDHLQVADSLEQLEVVKKHPRIATALADLDDTEVLEAIRTKKAGGGQEPPVKQAELDALLAAPEGFGDDVPIDEDFHARRLPENAWRRSSKSDGIECVIQLHRLREVMALTGFTRFEAIMPDIQGEYESDVHCAQLAEETKWFPAVENRGEGVFVQLRASAVKSWLERGGVEQRLEQLNAGHERWLKEQRIKRLFPGGPYIMMHTLSHLLIQSLAMRCGYPASSIRERIYADTEGERYGLMLYTRSPDAEGTLGGLVAEGRHIEDHLLNALRACALCSNDPICAQHTPSESMEKRWLHGAACHGCALVAETSCEMRNEYLDRALVVPILGVPDAAFFGGGLW